MATIHVPTSEGLLRSLSMLAAARGTTMREEVNEACRLHVERQARLVMSAAEQMSPEHVAGSSRSNTDATREE